MRCNKCNSERVVKNGTKNGNKYYKCKECGAQFSEAVQSSEPYQRFAVVLYCVGLSLRTIGALLGYSNVAILFWVRNFASTHYDKPIPKGEIVLELDEMRHFIKQKNVDLESVLQNNWTTY